MKSPRLALSVIALAQLMVALDATIVSIALPSVQHALGFSDAARQWMITAYMLPFAGLLLLGGRIADAFGRRRVFLLALPAFALASAFGGAAQTFYALVAARALQGISAALLSPTALSLVAVTFREPRERAKAFAVYGAIAGSGATLGLILGGALTQWATWRLCLYVNVPIALVAIAGGRLALPADGERGALRVDIFGALLATAGLVAIVFGLSSRSFAVPLAVGIALLTLFVFYETRAANPLVPLTLVWNRRRGGAAIVAALAVVGMFGLFLLLTYYFQVILHFSPLQAGLAFLPMTAASLFGSGMIARRAVLRFPPRFVMAPALVVSAAGMALLGRIDVDSVYWIDVLPAEILVGLGIGSVMLPAFSLGTQGAPPRDAGIASALINTATQVGGSLGAALLNAVAGRGNASASAAAIVHGYGAAARTSAVVLLVAAVIAMIMIDAPRPSPQARPA